MDNVEHGHSERVRMLLIYLLKKHIIIKNNTGQDVVQLTIGKS